MRPFLLVIAAVLTAGAASRPATPPAVPAVRADSAPPSSAWLALLPDGETKRQFILDCTGCHQFDERMALRFGEPRSQSEWAEAIRRMLGFAGPASGFPVISARQHPESTAAWLVRSLGSRRPEFSPRTMRGEVTEFPFPAPQDLPHDLAVDSTGRVVVTGMFTGAMHVLDPETGTFERVEIPVEKANPRAVEIDRRGRWWVVLGNPGLLARFDGMGWETFNVDVYAHSVALDSAGGAWVNGHFTRQPELLVGIDSLGAIRRAPLPEHPELGRVSGGPIPYELRTGPDGTLWMSELQGNRMVAYEPGSARARVFPLPGPASGPRRFDVDQAGIVWIPAYGTGTLVRLDPVSGEFREIDLPVRNAAPYVVRADPRDGALWIGTGAADMLLRYDPGSGRFDSFPLPTRGALIRHLVVDSSRGEVWLAYGESPGKAPARIARVRPGIPATR